MGTKASLGSKFRTERVVVWTKACGEMYGGLEMRISQCSMPLSRSRPMSGVTGLSDAPGPLASTSACANFVCGNSQRRPLYLARFTHRDETSTPSNWRSETRVELRKRPSNKSGIQPVPVQRSRMRNRWGRAREAWRRSARKVMDAAVSCLKKKSQYWAGQSEVGRSDSPGNEHARPAGNLKVAKELGAENVL